MTATAGASNSAAHSSYSDFDILRTKRLEWIGDSLDRLREFEPEAKRLAGYQLERVQAGKEPSDFKPMPSVGLGVNEVRVRTTGAYRVFYVAKFVEAVYVLHAFQKKGNKTPKEDMELGRRRFRALVQERKQRT